MFRVSAFLQRFKTTVQICDTNQYENIYFSFRNGVPNFLKYVKSGSLGKNSPYVYASHQEGVKATKSIFYTCSGFRFITK